ncbi:MAG: gliding motility-associated C-terminal domain-containing protein [Flavobacteriales bacterium]|nr:gliding motility-associated C-terminal domain-containing protein [Flavobacteriales bacterium]MDG1779474.1 gliding motility-associated C-terminal domain-containing protein [Flavobacteriales bacterium]MDG2244840.1 gliding motility-associated C-terminal domain-containing protein [Flavobacteriales bacterium]
MTRLSILSILFILFVSSMNAQNCDDPALLCAETNNEETITTANPVSFDCIDADFSFFYNFTTNNLANPGNVTVNIDVLDCFNNGLSDTVQAVIVEVIPGADPCLNSSYVAVSPCVSDTLNLQMESDDLQPNTDYLVILGTDHSPFDGPCGFDIQIEGPAVDISAGQFGDMGFFVTGDILVTLGESVTLSAQGADAIPGYSWSPGTFIDDPIGNDVLSFPEETIDYTVTGFIGDCEVTDVVTVIVGPPIGIPNTITPNGDGINDLWKISGISEFPRVEVSVFDRWGQQVYRDSGYEQPWNGERANGQFLPTAAYYYVIELNSANINIEPITGVITIIH